MTVAHEAPPKSHPRCPGCRRPAPLLVEGSGLCIGCDSLIPTRPFPGDDVMVQNLGQPLAYIGGNGHRPIPMATDIGVRRTHKPAQPKPTGLDWSRHGNPAIASVTQLPAERACKECRLDTAVEDLVDGFCGVCRDLATQRFAPTGTAPEDRPAPAPCLTSTEPAQEVVTVATPSKPPYVDDIVAIMVATDGHSDPAVRAARKVVANALVNLHKTLAGVFPQTSAVAASPSAAAGNPRRSYKRLTADEVGSICLRYELGESTTQLGRAFGVSATTISNKLREAGIKARPKAGA